MASERWQQVWSLFHDALERPVAARADWLREAAAGDSALHDEVASLLQAHAAGSSPLDRPPPAPPLRDAVGVGDCLGPWRLLREVGAGGMGRVFEVERADGRYAQRAALKRLSPALAHPAFVGRFERERQIMAALEHPHIARLLDGGSSDDGLPWLVMEFVDGAPIDRWCAQRRLPLRERLRLVAAVCDAVDYAHRHLVVHRDLKPSNVLVDESGVPHLVDFGIAKLLGSGAGAGAQTEAFGPRLLTPRYASPEQLAGAPIGVASDVYSLGVLLYELAAGAAPYATEDLSPEAVAERIRTADPPSLRTAARRAHARAQDPPRWPRERLPAELDWIVRRALKAEPAARYPSAAALAADLRALLAHRPVQARPDSAAYRLRKFVRRRWPWVAAALLFTAMAGAFAWRLAQESARTRAALAQTELERDRATRTAGFLAELFALADPTQAQGREVSAREVLERGRAQLERRDDLPPRVRVTLLDALAEVHRNAGAYDAAAELLAEARTLLPEAGSDALAADTLSDLGHTLELRGQHQQARVELEQALALQRQRGDALGVAEVAERLAVVLQSLGQREAALPLFEEAQAIRVARLPPDDGRVADAALRLGSWYWVAGRLDEAEPWYRRALELRRAARPADLPELARAIDAYGALEHARGRYAQAEPLFVEALALRRRVLGDRHRHTADSLSNLGACRYDRGDDAGAEPALREALAIYQRVLPHDSPVLGKTLNNLALVRQRQRDPVEARALFERALAINRAAYGPRHARVAGNLNNLGVLAEEADDLAGAETAFREALAILQAQGDDSHPQLAYALTNLGRVRYWRGDPGEAAALLGRALAIRQSRLPPTHPALAETLTWNGYVACRATPGAAPAAQLAQALAIREAALGADAVATVESRAMGGACRVAAGESSAGRAQYRAAQGALAAARGPRDRLVRELDAWVAQGGGPRGD